MFTSPMNTATTKTTSYKVVIPFYVYAALSFFVATLFLFISSDAFFIHYFHPHILAITHTMALGWATMLILGASHQLVPVLIEGKLFSETLAYLSFILAGIGIPLLVFGFYTFNMKAPAQWGGSLVALALLAYLINIAGSILKSKCDNIHALFVLSATIWLLFTVLLGLMLVFNFSRTLLSENSVHYLPLHAHAGIIGWFLLMVIGVASRLIPMFLISKYTNVRLLRIIFFLINGALLVYVLLFFYYNEKELTLFPIALLVIAVALFIYYCFQAHKKRLRKKVDDQIRISLLSVVLILFPLLLLLITIALLLTTTGEKLSLKLTYGFVIFFGWLTAIILGMTFKTLPFIAWNKVYHLRSASGKTANPRDLFNHDVFKIMSLFYLSGFVIFIIGILSTWILFLKIGAFFILVAALLYNFNVFKVIQHKPITP